MNLRNDRWLVEKLRERFGPRGKGGRRAYDMPEDDILQREEVTIDWAREWLLTKAELDSFQLSPAKQKLYEGKEYYWSSWEAPPPPVKPVKVSEQLRDVVDVPGNLVSLAHDSSAYVGLGSSGYRDRGTSEPLPLVLGRSGNGPLFVPEKYAVLPRGTVVVTCGRVLTDVPARPDLLVVATALGRFSVADGSLLAPA